MYVCMYIHTCIHTYTYIYVCILHTCIALSTLYLRRLLLCTHSRSLPQLGLDELASSHVLTVKALTRLEKEEPLRMQGPTTGKKPERACDGSDWARAAEIVKEVTAVVTNDISAPA